MKKRDFFIVGAPKCVTASMDDYLGQHPDIPMGHPEEIHYFGADLSYRALGLPISESISMLLGLDNS